MSERKRNDEAIKESARRLKWEREQRSWSQEQVAEMIGTTAPNVSRWERGITAPGPYFRQKLCEILEKNVKELGFVQDSHDDTEQELPEQKSISSVPVNSGYLWNVPHRRNPFFTGRKEVLQSLHDMLQTGAKAVLAQVQAISGLGGIGKTSTVTEYAYQYRNEYQAIFWIQAQTFDTLITDVIAIANLLNLPEKGDQDQRHILEAVKRWLNDHREWLLILDNTTLKISQLLRISFPRIVMVMCY